MSKNIDLAGGSMRIVENVIIIDDNEIEAFAVSQVLEEAAVSHETTFFVNARVAMDTLSKAEKFPELIIMDFTIPHLGGLAFLDWFQLQPESKTRNSHIILTTNMMRERSYMLRKLMQYNGVIGCIEKPLEVELLMEMLVQGLPNPMAANY